MIVEKLNKNLIIVAIVIAAVLISGAIFYTKRGEIGKFPELLTSQQAAQKAINFINKNLVPTTTTVTLIKATEESGLYKINFKVEEKQYDSYVTKNGKLLFFQGINMEENLEAGTSKNQPTQEEEKFSDEQLEALAKCLSEKGAKFYGASWCGWCKREKEIFGKAAEYLPYVECVDEKTQEMTAQCQEAEISAFPTWEVNGEKYTGFKKVRELAGLSGCPL